jgi:hypothetical protein
MILDENTTMESYRSRQEKGRLAIHSRGEFMPAGL